MSDKGNENTTKRRRRRKKKNTGVIILSVILCVFLAIGGFAWLAAKSVDDMISKGEEIVEDIRTPAEIKDDVVNILVCGIDQEEGRSGYLTDVVMYVSMDIKAKKISVLQIPRDTYVGTKVPTGGTYKINNVYNKGPQKEKMLNVVNLISDQYKLPIDHYVALDMEAFIALVNEFDEGLKMYVPYDVHVKDPKTGAVKLAVKAGWQTLDGATAEVVVRCRLYPNADVQRLDVQRYFYAAVLQRIKNDYSISDLIKSIPIFAKHLKTDPGLTFTRMGSLGAVGLQTPFSEMRLYKLPIAQSSVEDKTVYTTSKKMAADILNEAFRPYQSPVSADKLNIPQAPATSFTSTAPESIQDIIDEINKK